MSKIVLYNTKKWGTLKTVFRRPKAIGPINNPNHLQSINNMSAHIVLHCKKVFKMLLAYETWLALNSIKKLS
jgi:hypothetical protein